MPTAAPLILTLTLDDTSQSFFDHARARWFPPERNLLQAHVTLFHHLPGENLAPIKTHLASIGASQPPTSIAVSGLRSLGRGVAYTLSAPAIEALRANFASLWRTGLTPQDRQPWRPHITVQNKVSPAEARHLLAQLSLLFAPFTATATGLALWHYRGGPWENAAIIPFAGESTRQPPL
jgi:2'-5' RNA ligase